MKRFLIALCSMTLMAGVSTGCSVDSPFGNDSLDNAVVCEDVFTKEFCDSLPADDGQDGVDGTDGTDGVDGIPGLPGEPGAPGQDGTDGADGQDGEDGEDGQDGVDGEDGTDGQDGEDGAGGEDGQDGVDGEDGEDGEDGVDGINGADGSSCSVDAVEGGALISCDDGSYVYVWDGEDGESNSSTCDVSCNNKKATIICGDQPIVTVAGGCKEDDDD